MSTDGLRLDPDRAAAFESCIRSGGVALFPADTVYGLACDPLDAAACDRLNELKQRPPGKPAAVMFFALDQALGRLDGLSPRLRAALARLLPGPLTALVPNPSGLFPLAGPPGTDRLGVRVPALSPALEPLAGVAVPVLQSSANRSGGAEPRRLVDVDPAVRAGVDLALDGGELPGHASTVLDLTRMDEDGSFEILRRGPLSAADVRRALAG
ncbi:MAG: L-threonylcarbamoyladenylate synthase [Thermoleophilaceae bacterium]|nr:L-threonylcarbamoyladenylate synthase [Thermoleophilaceae bacterium]